MSSIIPDLRRKFRLLVSYGHARDINEIAKRLDKKPGTMLWWADGDAKRSPGAVPDKDFGAVLNLFLEVLVPSVTEEEAMRLIFGTAGSFEEQLRCGNATPFIHFVRSEGDSAACRLVCRSAHDMGLIETTLPRADEGAVLPVRAGDYFRIVVEQDLRHRHLLALQHTHMIWAKVSHTVDQKTGHVHVPGLSPDGSLAFMKEERDLGYNLFLVVVFHEPVPAVVTAHLKNQITLDVAILGKLAVHYDRQPQTRRGIFTMRLDIQEKRL